MKKSIEINTEYAKNNNKYMVYDLYKKEIGFTFVSSPNSSRQQVIEVSTCRDYVHERIRDHIRACEDGYDKVVPKLDFKRLRMLLIMGPESTIECKANLFSAKRALNVYEKMAGWKNLSKIVSVDYKNNHKSLLLTGPGEWMGHPVLMSMLTLIIRAGMKLGPLPSEEESLRRKWENISAPAEACVELDDYHDENAIYIAKASKYFPTLMKNYKDLFTTVGPAAYADAGHYSGGVVAMAEGNGFDKDLCVRIYEAYEKSEE